MKFSDLLLMLSIFSTFWFLWGSYHASQLGLLQHAVAYNYTMIISAVVTLAIIFIKLIKGIK